MACHEIAALRLGLMNLLGRDNEVERGHELAELGEAAKSPGPLGALLKASNMADLQKLFEASLTELHARVSQASVDDPKLPYWRSLMVLTKKVELDLASHLQSMTRFYLDLEDMHDFVHEIYPAE